MRCFRSLLMPVALLFSAPAYADLATFSSADAFDLAAPGLPRETFESGLIGPLGATLCTGPLSSASASACFPESGLLPGVTYSAAGASVQMIVIGAGSITVGNPSTALGPNSALSTMTLEFTGVTDVGLDLFPGLTAGNIVIEIFTVADASLGSFTVPGVLGGSFFGVSADDQIGRVTVASQSLPSFEFIDNVRFGTVTAVPEPSSLLLLAAGLAVVFVKARPSIER